jgi:hypothetical protein
MTERRLVKILVILGIALLLGGTSWIVLQNGPHDGQRDAPSGFVH